MPRKIVSKTSFLGGEAGYLLEGRSDLAQFQLGAQKLENFIVLKSGGITRRPGTRYVKNTLNDQPARLIPYVISYDSGDDIYVVELSMASSTTMALRVIRVSDNTVFTPTGSPFTVASTTDISEIQYAQSADTLFLTHKGFSPIVLKRTSSSPAFLVTGYVETPYVTAIPGIGSRANYFSMPYRDINVSSTTLSVSTATAGTGRTLTASAAIFDSGHVGTYFNVDVDGDGVYEGVALVTAFTDSTHVTVDVIANAAFAGTGAVTTWREGAWSTYRGFPRTVTLYSQRTVFGGNTAQPDTFWLSETGDFFQMSNTVATTGVSRPLVLTLDSGKLNQIRWMTGGKKLTIGTTSSEWVGTITEEGTSLKIQFDEETTHGSAYVQPAKSAYTTTFVQRAKQGLREMVFNFDNDAYQATDLNIFASHVGTIYGEFEGVTQTKSKILGLAFQESPFGIVWAFDNFGRLYGLTRDRQQQIASWHSHKVGGSVDTVNSNIGTFRAQVTSICVVPDANGELDRLWMVVRRKIGASDQYHVEYMNDIKPMHDLRISASSTDFWSFIDSPSYDVAVGSGNTAWTGFTRFASSNAYVVATGPNGNIVQNGLVAVDASGNFTIGTNATTLLIGFHADAEIRLLPFEGGDNPELYMRSEKGADQVAIRLRQTFGLKIGANRIPRSTGWEENTTFTTIPFDSASTSPIPTFTGVIEVNPPTRSDKDGSFALVMQDPWPCTILSICSRVVSNEV